MVKCLLAAKNKAASCKGRFMVRCVEGLEKYDRDQNGQESNSWWGLCSYSKGMLSLLSVVAWTELHDCSVSRGHDWCVYSTVNNSALEILSFCRKRLAEKTLHKVQVFASILFYRMPKLGQQTKGLSKKWSLLLNWRWAQQRGNKVRVQGGWVRSGHVHKRDYCGILFYQSIRFKSPHL